MKQVLSRRDVLTGTMAAGLTAMMSTAALAKGRSQTGGDPIVLAPASVDSSAGNRFYATIYPPQNYTSGVTYTVKVVRLDFSPNGSELVVNWADSNLNGISNGGFSTQITFHEASPPINVAVPIVPMSGSEPEIYAIVVVNATNSTMTTFKLTP